jgi:hypothetical protein
MKELRASVEIHATPEQVWEVLMDFESYPTWNPFITSLSGVAEPGAKLTARLEAPEGPAMTFKPTVLRADASREFRWLGRLGLPRIFDGEHIFELEAHEGGTRFVQREEFRGALVTPMLAWLGKSTEAGFRQMNEALKSRSEASAS